MSISSFRIHRWFAAALLVSGLLVSGTDAECSCLPSSITFKLDSSLAGESQTVPETSDAIEFAEYYLPADTVWDSEKDRLEIRIDEFESSGDPGGHNYYLDGDYAEGDEFTIIPRFNTTRVILIEYSKSTKNGNDRIYYGEVQFSFNDFNAECRDTPALEAGQTIGMLQVVRAGLPPDKCACGGDFDNPDFLVNEKDGKGCDWIEKQPQTRCSKANALYMCPSICNPACSTTGNCEDNEDYRHKDKDRRNCEWVAKDTKDRCSKKKNEPFLNCPGTCNPACEPR